MNISRVFSIAALVFSFCIFAAYTQALEPFLPVGCFEDSTSDRALPKLIANYRLSPPIIDWSDLKKTIDACARVAVSGGFVYFGIQFWGECWSGNDAHVTYDKHGNSSNCQDGVGMGYANFVYRFTGAENECLSPTPLSAADRAMSFVLSPSKQPMCDSLAEAWYRFLPPAGNAMATKCVSKMRCGTLVPGWIKPQYHPHPRKGIIDGVVCFNWRKQCCLWSEQIKVRNCGRFYVYKLKGPTIGCPLRYCGNL